MAYTGPAPDYSINKYTGGLTPSQISDYWAAKNVTPTTPAATSPFQATPGGQTATTGSTSAQNQITTQGTNYATSPFASLQPALQSGAAAGLSAGQKALNTGFDPESDLYKKQLQQNIDQSNVNLASRGLGMSGAGAGLADESRINFNNQWLDKQLGRQALGVNVNNAALGAARDLYGMGGTTTTTSNATGSTSGYETLPPAQSRAGGGMSGGSGGGGGDSGGLLPMPGLSTNQNMTPARFQNVLPLPEFRSTQPIYGNQAGIPAPGWTSPTGGLETDAGLAYRQYANPDQYPMATPNEVMSGLTGSDYTPYRAPNVSGTGMTAQQLLSGQSAPSYFGPSDQSLAIKPILSYQPTSMEDAQAAIDAYLAGTTDMSGYY